MLPFIHLQKGGYLPKKYTVNTIHEGGLLVLTSCESIETILKDKAEFIIKSDHLPNLLKGFGGSSHIFTVNSKRHGSVKKFFKSLQKGDNLKKLD